MNSSTNSDSNSPLLFAFYSLELLLHFLELPASILNFAFVARSFVLHPNIKFILLYQSACFLIRGISRSFICVEKYATGDATFEPRAAQFVYLFAVNSRNFLAHILILERIMATLWVRSYERKRGFAFTAIWMPITVLIAAANVYSLQVNLTPVPTFVISLAMLILAILEIIIFLWLLFYNEKMYSLHFQRQMPAPNLSIRYQMTENIRIGKQLIPTLLLHLWTIITSFSVWLSVTFSIGNVFYILAFTTSTNTFCSLLIEITTITRHPFLRRDFLVFLNAILEGGKCSIGRIDNRVAHEEGGGIDEGIALRDINGRRLVKEMDQNGHFQMLHSFWEGQRI